MENQLKRRNPSNKRKADEALSGEGPKRLGDDSLVHFILRRHPSDSSIPNLEREFLRTSSELKASIMYPCLVIIRFLFSDYFFVTGGTPLYLLEHETKDFCTAGCDRDTARRKTDCS